MRPKLTPQEIADLITEDQYGLPISTEPGAYSDAYNAAPEFDVGGGPEQPQQSTEMRACGATHCTNNVEGNLCSLSTINVNEYGGCEQFTPKAQETEQDSRYQEQETDVTGQESTNYDDPSIQPERQWQTGKWDPQNSAGP